VIILTVGKLRKALEGVADHLEVVVSVGFTRDTAEDEGLAEGRAVEVGVYEDAILISGSEDAAADVDKGALVDYFGAD
jgi:hypothetical protein